MILKKLIPTLAVSLLTFCLSAQQKTWIRQYPLEEKSFIENNGQWTGEFKTAIFGAQINGAMVYFYKNGWEYVYDEVKSGEEAWEREHGEPDEDFREEHPEEFENEVERHRVKFTWRGANQSVQVVAADKKSFFSAYAPDRYAYHPVTIKAAEYGKVTYTDIYDHIDLVFSYREDTIGLEYSFLLHPGANPADIELDISHADKVEHDANGNLLISFAMGAIVQHAPRAWKTADLADIGASFRLKKNTVTFAFSQQSGIVQDEIVLDPWVVNPGFTAQNKAFDIDHDGAGNVFAYGGQSPWKLKKFNAAGVTQWTYNTTYSSWYGDLAVHKNGDAFITEGCCGGGFQRISPTATVIWSQNFGVLELWTLAFDCSFSTLYLGKGYPDNKLHIMNMATGAFVSASASFGGGGGNEPRSLCWGPGNNMYLLLCTPTNNVVGVDPALTTFMNTASGYALVYNGPAYANGSNPTSAQNGISAGLNFVATSDGQTVFKRNLTTGASLGSVAVTGGSAGNNSGVLVDYCDNVFAGSQNIIYKYDQTLTQVGSAATTGAVYCLAPGLGGDVLASGNGFVGAYALGYQTQNFTVTTNITPAGCSCTGTASVNVVFNCNPTPVTVTWSNGSTGNSVSGLCAGNYYVVVETLTCLKDTSFFTIGGGGGGPGSGFPVNAVGTNISCFGANDGSINTNPAGTPPYTYAWSSGQTTQNISGLAPGTYIVDVTDNTGCVGSDTVVITEPPVLTATANGTPESCAGNDGTASVVAGGGTPGYAVLWSTGATTTTINGLTASTYTVTVTDTNGCTANDNVTIVNTGTNPNLSTLPATPLTCAQTTETITATSSTPVVTFSWVGPGIVSGANTATPVVNAPGTYVVTATVGSCSSVDSVVVTSNTTPPGVSTNGPVNISCNGTAVITANSPVGGVTYSWTGPGIVGASNAASVTVNAPGTYQVVVTDPVNGCADSTTTTATQSGGPTALQMTITGTTCGNSNGCIQINGVTGGTGPYTYSIGGAFSATTNYCNLASGNYTVSVQDASLCQFDTLINVAPSAGLTASVSVLQNISCNGAGDGELEIVFSGGVGPYDLTDLSTMAVQPGISSPYTIFNLSGGTFTYVVSDASGCTDTVSAALTDPALLTVSVSGNDSICAGQSTNLTALASGGVAPYSYNWNNGLPPGATNTASPFSSTTFTVTATDANGCTAIDSLPVFVQLMLPPAISVNVAADCAPLCVQFTDNSNPPAGTSYTWDFGDGFHDGNISPLHCYSNPGVYTVGLTISYAGCSQTSVLPNFIQVYSNPVAGFQATPQSVNLLNPVIFFQNQSAGAVSSSWNFGDGGSSADMEPTHTYGDTGMYTVTLIVETVNGCTDTVQGNVWVTGYFAFYAPNAFTPDGDGFNDVWMPIGSSIVDDEFKLMIFDRWGELIFKADAMNKGWDGMYKGIKAKEDVYVWKVFLKDKYGDYHQYYGHLTLLR